MATRANPNIGRGAEDTIGNRASEKVGSIGSSVPSGRTMAKKSGASISDRENEAGQSVRKAPTPKRIV